MNHMLPIPLAVILSSWRRGNLSAVSRRKLLTRKRLLPNVRTSGSAPAESTSPDALNGQELVAQAAQRLLLLPGIEAKTAPTRQYLRPASGRFGNLFAADQWAPADAAAGPETAGGCTKPRVCSKSVMATRSGSAAARATRRPCRALICGDCGKWPVALARPMFRHLPRCGWRWAACPNCWPHSIRISPLTHPSRMTIGTKLPVWSLEGHWKPAMLANLLPDQKAAIVAGERVDLSGLATSFAARRDRDSWSGSGDSLVSLRHFVLSLGGGRG